MQVGTRLRTIATLSFLLLLSSTAHATIYYASPSGNDANACATATTTTQTNNKQTVAGAVACGFAGDTVYLRAGTYTGGNATVDSQGHVVHSGTSYTNAITISGYPGETAIIQPPSGVSAVRLYGTGNSYIIFQDLVMDMDNCNSGCNSEGVILTGVNHIRFNRIELKNGYTFGFHAGGADFIEVMNSNIHHFGDATSFGTDGHCVYFTANDGLFEDNTVHDCGGYGFHIYNNAGAPGSAPSRNIIRRNRVYNTGISTLQIGYAIILGWGDGNQVYNNFFYNSQNGVQIYTNVSNTLFAFNTVYGNANNGIDYQYYGFGNVVRNNIIYGNGVNITDYGTGSGATVTADHNVITNPNFVSPGTGNFSIPITSVARDAGVTVSGITTDYVGTVRTVGGVPDVGAYEYVGTSGGAITITTTTLPTATFGVTYNRTLLTTGGSDPKVFSLSVGTLPTGLSLDPTGFIFGIPTGALGSSTFTVRVDEAGATNDTQVLTLTVAAEVLPSGRPLYIGPLRQEIQTFRRGVAPTCSDRVAKGDEWVDISGAVPVKKVSTTTCPTAPVWVVP